MTRILKQFKRKLVVILCPIMLLSGCEKPVQKKADEKNNKDPLVQQFEQWKLQQDPQLLRDYYQFMAQYLKYPPSLMELTTTRNYMPEQCYSKRFAVPPKKYWKNVVESLQLVEKLNHINYYQHYTITAIYRNPELNRCVQGASRSKHLYNYAVDFHVLAPKETNQKAREALVKKMCQFWRKEGENFKMGLGVYGNNRYHIDTQGYRTWGKDYKSTSSPCLQVIK